MKAHKVTCSQAPISVQTITLGTTLRLAYRLISYNSVD